MIADESAPYASGSWRARYAALHPKAYLALHLAGGVLLTMVLVWAFAAIADEIPEQGRLVEFDVALTRWIHTHDTEYGESIFQAISWLGAPALAVVLTIAALGWARARDWARVTAVLMAGVGGLLLNYLLKAVFHRGRPEFATEFITRQSWSFPSGHAMESLAAYGMLAFLLIGQRRAPVHRRALTGAAILLIGAIGVSRVYLGVHYLSDVVGGWLAGGAWLLVCITAYRFIQARLHPATATTDAHLVARRSIGT